MFKSFLSILVASSFMVISTGCASGGYKWTRRWSGFVNRQNIILRIVLYIITLPVYGITLLVDAVIFNTMDFWEGRVSQGTHNFQENNKTFYVKHEFQPGTKLKQSTIDVASLAGGKLKQFIIKETADKKIELYVDGVLRTRVENFSELPVISKFDSEGLLESRIPTNLDRRLLVQVSSKTREI